MKLTKNEYNCGLYEYLPSIGAKPPPQPHPNSPMQNAGAVFRNSSIYPFQYLTHSANNKLRPAASILFYFLVFNIGSAMYRTCDIKKFKNAYAVSIN